MVVDVAYIDDAPATSVDQINIGPDSLEIVRIRGSFVSGTGYNFKIVGVDLTQLVLTAKANY